MIYKNLDAKYGTLERQMDSVIREANQEIQALRDKYGGRLLRIQFIGF